MINLLSSLTSFPSFECVFFSHLVLNDEDNEYIYWRLSNKAKLKDSVFYRKRILSPFRHCLAVFYSFTKTSIVWLWTSNERVIYSTTFHVSSVSSIYLLCTHDLSDTNTHTSLKVRLVDFVLYVTWVLSK